MKFSMLVPTLGNREQEINRLFQSLESQTYKNFEVIVVSQSNHDNIDSILKQYSFEFKHIKIDEKGISNARNVGLEYIEGDILNFTDDDCWFDSKSLEKVKRYIEEYNPEIATFQSFDPIKNQYPKNFPKEKILGFNKKNILRQTSFDIYVNINKVPDFKIGFDKRFGVGVKYNSGEENIYLMDLYNRGYKKMYYFPEIIAFHPVKEHKYLQGESFVAKGPLFKRLFGNFVGFFMFIIFAIRKKSLVDNFSTLFKLAIKEFRAFKI